MGFLVPVQRSFLCRLQPCSSQVSHKHTHISIICDNGHVAHAAGPVPAAHEAATSVSSSCSASGASLKHYAGVLLQLWPAGSWSCPQTCISPALLNAELQAPSPCTLIRLASTWPD